MMRVAVEGLVCTTTFQATQFKKHAVLVCPPVFLLCIFLSLHFPIDPNVGFATQFASPYCCMTLYTITESLLSLLKNKAVQPQVRSQNCFPAEFESYAFNEFYRF